MPLSTLGPFGLGLQLVPFCLRAMTTYCCPKVEADKPTYCRGSTEEVRIMGYKNSGMGSLVFISVAVLCASGTGTSSNAPFLPFVDLSSQLSHFHLDMAYCFLASDMSTPLCLDGLFSRSKCHRAYHQRNHWLLFMNLQFPEGRDATPRQGKDAKSLMFCLLLSKGARIPQPIAKTMVLVLAMRRVKGVLPLSNSPAACLSPTNGKHQMLHSCSWHQQLLQENLSPSCCPMCIYVYLYISIQLAKKQTRRTWLKGGVCIALNTQNVQEVVAAEY